VQAKVPPSALDGVGAGVVRGFAPCTGALLMLDNSENARQPIELWTVWGWAQWPSQRNLKARRLRVPLQPLELLLGSLASSL